MRKAFTLIELLIVVAIIAILAAIAVPNFLEAQVRARVSRAKADIRTVIVGVESFQVDCNVYPVCASGNKSINANIQAVPGSKKDIRVTFANYINSKIGKRYFTLTTPVSYLATIPVDPFADSGQGNFGYTNAYEMGWLIWSYGPNGDEIFGSEIDLALKGCEKWASSQWDKCTIYSPVKSTPLPGLSWITYDPTNGAASPGDVWSAF